MTDRNSISYEQPLNERMRTFLRLEHLFVETEHHLGDSSIWGRRAAMAGLLDILTVLSRHDLRLECAKELEEHYASLDRLRDHAAVDRARLDEVLTKLDHLARDMKRIPPQFASYLIRNNELLNSINNRGAIPGGVCGFDLPSYQHWLRRPEVTQDEDFQYWYRQIAPFRSAIRLILSLLRDGGEPTNYTAEGGVLVHNTDTGTRLLRVTVAGDEDVYPEISAGRHRSTIRFMEQTGAELRVAQTGRDIPFTIVCCRL